MNERHALTSTIAGKMLQRGFSTLGSRDTFLGGVQRLHNIMVLFPSLLLQKKPRDSAFRSLSIVASKVATLDGMAALYGRELIRRAYAVKNQFSVNQQTLITKWNDDVNALSDKALGGLSLSQLRADTLLADPFSNLRISEDHGLPKLPKTRCGTCGRMQPFYCTHCYIPNHSDSKDKFPCITLPMNVEIILHPSVRRNRSTALTAQLVTNNQVSVRVWPSLGVYSPTSTLVVFPSDDAVTLTELVERINRRNGTASSSSTGATTTKTATATATSAPSVAIKTNDTDSSTTTSSTSTGIAPLEERLEAMSSLERVIILEGSWDQAQLMLSHPKLAPLVRVQLQPRSAVTVTTTATVPSITTATATSSSSASVETKTITKTLPSADAAAGSAMASGSHAMPSVAADDGEFRTTFWRYQSCGAGFLATVEAIYYWFLYHHRVTQPTEKYDGRYDDLLWVYKMAHHRVRQYYLDNPKLLPYVWF